MRAILTSQLENTDNKFRNDNPNFRTRDRIYIPSFTFSNLKDKSSEERRAAATDYAMMNGAINRITKMTKHIAATFWYRDALSQNSIKTAAWDNGFTSVDRPNLETNIVRPVLRLDIAFYHALHNAFPELIKMEKVKEKAYITFGEFPKSHASNEAELDRLFKEGKLKQTGKEYVGFAKLDGSFNLNTEYEYEGKKYVRVTCMQTQNFGDEFNSFSDGTIKPKNYDITWAVVEPIVWEIGNMEALPREFNPQGIGWQNYIELISKDGIIGGMPFYPLHNSKIESVLWQNSPIRAYLNGYDIYEELNKGNGQKEFKAQKNFNFKEHNFLKESGIADLERLILTPEEKAEEERKELERERQIDEENQAKWNEWVDWANKQYGLDDGRTE